MVIVGFHPKGFDRLVRAMDAIAESAEEDVIFQIGNSEYEPRHGSHFRFRGDDREIDQLIGQARVVVGHAGVGMIIEGLEHGRPLVVIPRRKSLREHVDDHQFETAQRLSQEGLLRVVSDMSDLDNVLFGDAPLTQTEDRFPSHEREKLTASLQAYIQTLA